MENKRATLGLRKRKRKALNLIFGELSEISFEEKTTKEALIDIIDNAVTTMITIPLKDDHLGDIREDVVRLIQLRDIIKLC